MARKFSGPIASIVDQADGRVHRVASAHPVQNPTCWRIDPNLATSSAFVETATKMLGHGLDVASGSLDSHARALCALVMVSSVVKVSRRR